MIMLVHPITLKKLNLMRGDAILVRLLMQQRQLGWLMLYQPGALRDTRGTARKQACS